MCAARAMTRWPTPMSLARPRAFTLSSPGQYSPGTSPTRASTPSPLKASTAISVIASKRSRIPSRGAPSGITHESAIVPS